jgi:hypothetical protein
MAIFFLILKGIWFSYPLVANRCAFSYDLGVGLGIAAFQASVGANPYAKNAANNTLVARRRLVGYHYIAQSYSDSVDAITIAEITPDTFTPLTTTALVSIEIHSMSAGSAFRLGLLLGVAEGQATGYWHQSAYIAHTQLTQASDLMKQQFPKVYFEPGLLENALKLTQTYEERQSDAYAAITALRSSCRQRLTLTLDYV